VKSFRSNTKGQFVIIAALLIAALTLSVAVYIHQMSSNRIQLEYRPVSEVVLGITSDMERALTYALSNASKQYYATGNISAARNAGNTSLLRWQRSVLAAYPQLGINLDFAEAASFTFLWNNPSDNSGYSQAIIPNYGLDVNSYGFMGWTGFSAKYVRLKIYDLTYINESYSTIDFRLVQFVTAGSGAVPIPNLTADDITVLANVTVSAQLQGTPYAPQYLGGGNYSLALKNPVPNLHPIAVTLIVSTPEDQILVSASITSKVQVILQSQWINSPTPDSATNLNVILGQSIYPLPSNITDWQKLQPYLCFLSNTTTSSLPPYCVFVNWTTTGDISVTNAYRNETNILPNGSGNITVFYNLLWPTSSVFNLTVTSRLDGSSIDTNAGSVTFDSVTYPLLPVSFIRIAPSHSITFSLSSSMQTQGYTFARWKTSTDLIVIGDPYNNSTGIALLGNGTLTAVYQQRKIVLDSYEYNGTTAHLGNIRLGAYDYLNLPATLVPANATVGNGVYNLMYTPNSSTYTFLWWEITGDIILTGGDTSNTTVRIGGNGSITAVYQQGSVNPPWVPGGTLFVDAKGSQDYWLDFTIPDKSGHLASKASTGNAKANLTVTADPISASITCDPIISVTAYIGISPANAPLRTLEFEVGFTYEGNYYELGYDMFTIVGSPATKYEMYMDITNVSFPGANGVIPQGSTITLKVTATFVSVPPGGFIFLYYGPDRPSCITLFT
jgi:hypothetical protein